MTPCAPSLSRGANGDGKSGAHWSGSARRLEDRLGPVLSSPPGFAGPTGHESRLLYVVGIALHDLRLISFLLGIGAVARPMVSMYGQGSRRPAGRLFSSCATMMSISDLLPASFRISRCGQRSLTSRPSRPGHPCSGRPRRPHGASRREGAAGRRHHETGLARGAILTAGANRPGLGNEARCQKHQPSHL
jgi:hypothetical protein